MNRNMNRNDVLEMASEAGMILVTDDWLERFAALVAASARGDYHEGWEEGYKAGVLAEREECAAAIRARGRGDEPT